MRKMSMSDVLARERAIISEGTSNTSNYPLFYSYKDRYNYKNIREAMDRWRNYSPIIEKCTDKLLELFEIVNENGSIKQVEDATMLVTKNLSELKNINDVKSQLRLIENTDSILESLNDISICENITNTHKDISKRFNINEYVQTNCSDGNESDCIYGICEFIDTYNLGLNTKYRTCINETQYLFSKNAIDYPSNSIIENVTDYFLFNHMNENDWDREILNIMEQTIDENSFIHDKSYIQYLQSISKDDDIIEEENEFELKPKLILESKKDLVSMFKASPIKTFPLFKKALMETFLNLHREEDVVDECPNMLALCFYAFILCGLFAISLWLALVGTIVAIIISHTLTRKSTDKALKAWYKHKIKAKKKLDKETDPDKKKRLEEYIKGLNRGIEKLEEHKDNLKDEDEKYAFEDRPDELKDKDDDFDFTFEEIQFLNDYDPVLEDADVINEMSIGNTITLAVDKAKSYVSKLDVAQQVACRTLDSICSKVTNGFKKAMTLGSREAVVRGDALPAMSRCLKLALAGGFLWAINPLLAIAGAIATYVCRSDEMRKERQMFSDELDVELTMVDKYIKNAEEKNDLKKMRELLLIKKKLQSHYGRLKYKMKVNYNDHDLDPLRDGMQG